MYTQAALQQTSNALAELDAVLSLASVAVDLGLVRPVLVADNVIVIKVRATAPARIEARTVVLLCYMLLQAPVCHLCSTCRTRLSALILARVLSTTASHTLPVAMSTLGLPTQHIDVYVKYTCAVYSSMTHVTVLQALQKSLTTTSLTVTRTVAKIVETAFRGGVTHCKSS
jgi:hypothetical protein